MKYRQIGSSELHASIIGLGTFELGGSSWWDPVDKDLAISSIRRSLDLGVNFIDTAPVYGFGESERIVGEAIRGVRDKFIISTKVGEEFTGYDQGRFHYSHDGKDVYTCLTPSSIHRQLESSLYNLGTDYIDIYTIHFFFEDPSVGRIDDIFSTLDSLIASGKVRTVGLSNISASHLRLFEDFLATHVSCVQLYTNVLDHALLDVEILRLMESNGISGIGINCLAKGLLSGTFPDDYIIKDRSERSESPWFLQGRISKVNSMIDGWRSLILEYEATPASLALAWVLSQNEVSHVLTGVTNFQHVIEAVSSANISLTDKDIRLMTSDAMSLRNQCIDSFIQGSYNFIRSLSHNKTPVAIWGAGVTLDYLCRRLPISDCNIVGVFDSNPSLCGEVRFGREIRMLQEATNYLPMGTILLVAIPSNPDDLNKCLQEAGIDVSETIHLGTLKALCK